MTQSKYRIGIDAGGTKTLACLYQEGEEIASFVTGMGNVAVNYHLALSHIQSAVQAVLKEKGLSLNQIEAISLGVAGLSLHRQRLEEDLAKKWACPLLLGTDGEMGHWASFQGGPGLLLIAGTGSMALSRQGKDFKLVGGWGHILGDQGSAYWLGKSLLVTYIDYLESNTCPQGFEAYLPQLSQALPSRQAILNLVYNQPKQDVASLALLINYFPGNPYGEGLLTQAGDHLASLVQKAWPAKSQPIPLALEGSVLLKNLSLQTYFFDQLQARGYSWKLVAYQSPCRAVLGRSV